MEDLQQEITLCKLQAPTSNLQPTPWGKPSGSSNYQEETQRSPFQKGEGGIPWAIHLQLQHQCDQMEAGFLHHLLSPLRSAPADLEVGHLINALASGLHLGTPRINTFSGKAMPSKTELSFKQW